jgi:F420-dependent oxidoreductase-like protein
MDVAIMLEGQQGLNWARLERLARAAEELGFAGLYRSDHFVDPAPPDHDSLELWVSLAWLASHTRRIDFGPLVSPVSFRDPVMTARMAAAVDDLSGGRLHLGLGAGWNEREHTMFGYHLLDTGPRFARFAEGLEVVTRLLRADGPVDLQGDYYQLRGARLLPRPRRPGGPPIVIGGNGERRTLPLVARYADEWNGVFLTPERFAARSARLDRLLAEQGRPPQAVRRTLMTGIVFDERRAAVEQAAAAHGQTPDELRARGMVVGDGAAVREQLAALEAAGVQRVMLQWLALDDLAGLEALARALEPLRR